MKTNVVYLYICICVYIYIVCPYCHDILNNPGFPQYSPTQINTCQREPPKKEEHPTQKMVISTFFPTLR